MNGTPATEPLQGHRRYQKIRDLNSGTYGRVVLAKDLHMADKPHQQQVAIKFLERGDKISKYVEREIINHSVLIHPHVIQFREVFLTRDHLAISMEYAAGGDMFQYVKKHGGLKEHDARWFFQQLIVALDYCHRKDVVNRDIKLENTLLDGSAKPLIKICDFGYSKHLQNDSMPKSRVGTPGYTAPEIIRRRSHHDVSGYSGKMVDVWSAGVMLYVMLFCCYPFERPSEHNLSPVEKTRAVMERILRADYHFPQGIHVSSACRDLLRGILRVDPLQRLTIDQIQRHPWVQVDMPANWLEFNTRCLASQGRTDALVEENRQHVHAIVEEARTVGPGRGRGTYDEDDGMEEEPSQGPGNPIDSVDFGEEYSLQQEEEEAEDTELYLQGSYDQDSALTHNQHHVHQQAAGGR